MKKKGEFKKPKKAQGRQTVFTRYVNHKLQELLDKAEEEHNKPKRKK